MRLRGGARVVGGVCVRDSPGVVVGLSLKWIVSSVSSISLWG